MFRFIELVFTILIALSFVRSALKFVQNLMSGNPRQSPPLRQQPQPQQPAGPTMLQQDPVCGTYVSVESSLKRIVGGRVLHFCSPECRDRYPA